MLLYSVFNWFLIFSVHKIDNYVPSNPKMSGYRSISFPFFFVTVSNVLLYYLG